MSDSLRPHFTACLLTPFLVPAVTTGWSGHQMLGQKFYWRVIPWRTRNVSASLVGHSGVKICQRKADWVQSCPLPRFNQSLADSQCKNITSEAKADIEDAKRWRSAANHMPHSWAVGLLRGICRPHHSVCQMSHTISASVLWFLNLFLIVTINPRIGSFKCCPCWRSSSLLQGKGKVDTDADTWRC